MAVNTSWCLEADKRQTLLTAATSCKGLSANAAPVSKLVETCRSKALRLPLGAWQYAVLADVSKLKLRCTLRADQCTATSIRPAKLRASDGRPQQVGFLCSLADEITITSTCGLLPAHKNALSCVLAAAYMPSQFLLGKQESSVF